MTPDFDRLALEFRFYSNVHHVIGIKSLLHSVHFGWCHDNCLLPPALNDLHTTKNGGVKILSVMDCLDVRSLHCDRDMARHLSESQILARRIVDKFAPTIDRARIIAHAFRHRSHDEHYLVQRIGDPMSLRLLSHRIDEICLQSGLDNCLPHRVIQNSCHDGIIGIYLTDVRYQNRTRGAHSSDNWFVIGSDGMNLSPAESFRSHANYCSCFTCLAQHDVALRTTAILFDWVALMSFPYFQKCAFNYSRHPDH